SLKLTLNPNEIDCICGYRSPSVVSSSGSQSLKSENVRRFEPLANTRQLRTPIRSVALPAKVYPTSTLLRRMKLISRSHHVDGRSLLAVARLPNLGQNTSWLGFSGVHRSSIFEKIFPAPNTEPGNQLSPPNSW